MENTKDIFNPLDSNFVQNPYAVYDILREQDPVHRTSLGMWVLTRYDDVSAGLISSSLSNRPAPFALVNRRNADRYVAAAVANGTLAFLDPPEHANPRKLIATMLKAFLKGKEPVIKEVVDRLLVEMRGMRQIDFMNDFANKFATRCICRVMGFPEEDVQMLNQWSNMYFYLFHSIPNMEILEKVNIALTEFGNYVGEKLEERRKSPKDDLMSLLIHSERQGFSFSERELIDNCMLLTADGIENVQTGLATTVATLLKHEDQLALMMDNPELIDKAIDECLRYESPGQYQGRIATETIEIGGETIRKNSVVLLALASANRDPEIFDEPDRFLINRRHGPKHLAFGHGRHACIGGAMVMMEFRIALKAIFDGSRTLQMTDDKIVWTTRAGHRWPEALLLKITEH